MKLPHSIECEKSLLGCVILDNAILPRLSVTVDDFYDSKHRAVFQAMSKLHADGRPIEFTTLATELGNDKDGASDIDFLVSLMDASSSAANFQHYAGILQEKSRLRDLVALAANIHNKCVESPDKGAIIKLLNGVQTLLAELSPKDDKGSGMLSSLVKQQIELTKAIRDGNIVNNAVKTGFHDVDVHIDGLVPGNLIVVAGRPGTGKTAFALDVILNLIKKGMSACYYSFEMTCAEITRRLISKQTGVGLKNLMNGLLSDSDIIELSKLTDDKFLDNLFITEKNTTPAQIELDIDKWNSEHKDSPLRCIVIDHLQLVGLHDSKAYERRDLQLAKYTGLLKDIAKRKELTVLLLSQLNRALDTRNKEEKLPKLSDLRDSGAIEQDADVVLGLYRRALDTQDPTDDSGTCIILKNRNGRVGRVELTWIGKIASYKSKAREATPVYTPKPVVKKAEKPTPTRIMIDPDTGEKSELF